jgi:CDP-diacylglycerol--glycerol-3-phosphate 3-phosphatidyltransferase/cardiolipin synthase
MPSSIIRATPTSLTVLRLVLGIAFPWTSAQWRLAALVAAMATEFLDGQIARLLHAESITGRILDPIADKVFVIAVLATLLKEGTLTFGQLLLVISRDIIVIVGASWFAARRGLSALRRMPPSLLGKLATAAQLLFLLALNVTTRGESALLLVVSGLSLAAGVDYIRRFRSVQVLARLPPQRNPLLYSRSLRITSA